MVIFGADVRGQYLEGVNVEHSGGRKGDGGAERSVAGRVVAGGSVVVAWLCVGVFPGACGHY